MKHFTIAGWLMAAFAGLLVMIVAQYPAVAQVAQTANLVAEEYDLIASRGPHHKIVDTTIATLDKDGKEIERQTHYTHLEIGQNYFSGGEWHESESTVEPHPRGAAALKGSYKVVFGENLNRAGAIEITLPEGGLLKVHPLGLYYLNRQSGKSVLLSAMKDSVGEILPPNQVIYRNAFAGVRADIRYTYEKSGFESAVILREQIASPDAYGLDSQATVLEMATEFMGAEPSVREMVLRSDNDDARPTPLASPDVVDQWLDFGQWLLVPGTAFPLGAENGKSRGMAVAKIWNRTGERRILSEQVEYAALASIWTNLPAQKAQVQALSPGERAWPASPPAGGQERDMKTVEQPTVDPGVVIDWSAIVSGSSVAFASGQTYRVSGAVTFTGTITFGAAYLKYDPGATVTALGAVTGGGAILTAVADTTVGDLIVASPPCGLYADSALTIQTTGTQTLSGMEIRYATTGINVYALGSPALTVGLPNLRVLSGSIGINLSPSSSGNVTVTASSLYTCGVTTPTSVWTGLSTPGATTCGANTAPSLPTLPAQLVTPGGSFGINFNIADAQTPNSISVTASSSNTSLVPNNNLSVTGCGTVWSLNVTSLSGGSGQTTITVTASDGPLSSTSAFVVTVNAPPTISPLSDRNTALSTSKRISFTITDPDDPTAGMQPTVTSSDQNLVPQANIEVGGDSDKRVMRLTPVANKPGTTTITVTVADSHGGTASRSFLFSVNRDFRNADPPDGGNGAGMGGGSAGGGSQTYWGPCGPIDLDSIKAQLAVQADDTCCSADPFGGSPADINPTASAVFGFDANCGAGCKYKVTMTVNANLFVHPDNVGSVAVGGKTAVVASPCESCTVSGCRMSGDIQGTVEFVVQHGEEVQLTYVGYTFSEGGGMINGHAEVTDIKIAPYEDDTACVNCSTDGFATNSGQAHSASVGLSLGRSLYGRRPVTVRLFEVNATPALTSPQSLFAVTARSGDVDVVPFTPSNGVSQVKAPKGLVNVVQTNETNYAVEFFGNNGIGNNGTKGTNGLYVLNGTPALCSYQVVNPTGSTNDSSCVRLIQCRSGSLYTSEFIYTTATATWQYSSGNGLYLQKRQYATNGAVRTETRTVHNPVSASQTVRKSTEKYRDFAWGNAIVEHTLDPDTAQLKTTYSYYTNTSDNGYGKLQQLINADGSWQLFEYDTQQRVIRIYSSFLNQSVTTNPSLCRKVEYDYNPITVAGDDGTYRPHLPRREIGYVKGQEISRKYYVYKQAEKQQITCMAAGALWNDAANLVTVIKRVGNGIFRDDLLSVNRPDGTLSLYQYATNANPAWKMSTALVGQPNAQGTDIFDGTKTITTVSLSGEMMTNQVFDIASGNVLIDQQIYSDCDEQQRPRRVDFLDNTFTYTQYGCCGPDYVRQRDGTTNYFTYDALRRKATETANGVSTIYTYDGAGRVVTVARQGTDFTQVILKRVGFDLAGRLTAETNALGTVTTYVDAIDGQGQTVKTTTYASGTSDAATRIETFAKDGRLLKVTGTSVGAPQRYEYDVEQEGSSWREYKREIKLDSNSADTLEVNKIYYDMAGREYKTVFSAASGSPSRQLFFNSLGQLSKTVDPDGVTTLYTNNLKGELEYTAADTNRDGIIDFGGQDRISRTISDVVANYGTNVRRTRTYENPTINSSAQLLTSTLEVSTDGLRTWTSQFGLLTKTQSAYGSGVRYVTNTAPDGSYSVSYYLNTRLQSMTRYDSGGTQVGITSYAYDAHGRMAAATDARNGTTTYTYDNMDRVTVATTPPPGNGQSAQTTQTFYDNLGRVWKTVLPDGTSVTNEYFATGLLKKTYGSRTYSVEYTYDSQGRVKTMKTWQNFSGNSGTATTTWNYDAYRGFLTSKLDANGYGPSYSYSAAGRLTLTTWARSAQAITIGYDNLGLVAYRQYPGTGPTNPYFTYDRRNRMTLLTQGGNTTSFFYNDAGQLLGQSQSGGTLSGFALTNQFDSFLRKSYVAVKAPSGSWYSPASYAYDNASRLSTVTFNSSTVSYTYLANSPFAGNITSQQSGSTRLTVNKTYDYLNRLGSISSSPSGAASIGYGYRYNDASQRVQANLADGSFWVYEYDALGQVKTGKRYWSDWTPVAGQQFEYGFDDIGNRSSTKAGGDAGGTSLRSASYTPTSLNQLSSRTVPGAVDIVGLANSAATVTVNSQATYRRGEYFWNAAAISNGSGPVYPSITVDAVNGGSSSNRTGNVLLPASSESFGHDLDGNLASDGLWTYTWDAENRLSSLQSISAVPTAARRKLDFEYDYLGRRIAKNVSTWNGSSYVWQSGTKFIYDGWNLIGEFDSGNSFVRAYAWGTDLSGSLQGAGGVGGLIGVAAASGAAFFPAYDGNGNVAAFIDASSGQVAAQTEYGPFGEVIRATSSIASVIPIRWSTKYTDLETDLVYYGLRYYNPSTGRWLSRDPIEEKGGANLFAFVRNSPESSIDPLGKDPFLPYPGYPGPFQPPTPPPPISPPSLSLGNTCTNPDVADAINRANGAMQRGNCRKWFQEHGARGESFSVHCRGKCKFWCLVGETTFTFPGVNGIGVCQDNVGRYGPEGLASLLIHEAAHHYCTIFVGREGCAEDAQEACKDEL